LFALPACACRFGLMRIAQSKALRIQGIDDCECHRPILRVGGSGRIRGSTHSSQLRGRLHNRLGQPSASHANRASSLENSPFRGGRARYISRSSPAGGALMKRRRRRRSSGERQSTKGKISSALRRFGIRPILPDGRGRSMTWWQKSKERRSASPQSSRSLIPSRGSTHSSQLPRTSARRISRRTREPHRRFGDRQSGHSDSFRVDDSGVGPLGKGRTDNRE